MHSRSPSLQPSIFLPIFPFLELPMSWPRGRHGCGRFRNYFECATCFNLHKVLLCFTATSISHFNVIQWGFHSWSGDIKDALELKLRKVLIRGLLKRDLRSYN